MVSRTLRRWIGSESPPRGREARGISEAKFEGRPSDRSKPARVSRRTVLIGAAGATSFLALMSGSAEAVCRHEASADQRRRGRFGRGYGLRQQNSRARRARPAAKVRASLTPLEFPPINTDP